MNLSKHTISLLTTSVLSFSLISCKETKKNVSSNVEEPLNNKNNEQPIIKSYETIMQEEITNYEKLSETLESITDLESAKSAIPTLADISFKFNRIKIDLENAEPLSTESLKKLRDNFKAKRTQVIANVAKNLKRLKGTQPEAYSVTSKIIQGITQ